MEVAPAGTTGPIGDSVSLAIPQGANTIVYSVGSLATGTYQVLAQEFDL